jgi:DNA-binding CsgD family transcriptional regulator
VSIATGERAYLDAHRGDTAKAQARLDAFRRRRLPLQFGRDNPGAAELAVLEAAGSTADAATLVRSLWTTARAQPGRGALEHAAEAMRVALSTGQRRLAHQLADDVRGDLADAEAGRRGIEPTVLLRGMALLLQGMAEDAAESLDAAAELFERQGWAWLRLQALEELAASGSAGRVRARAAAEAALSGYERIGARVDRDRLLARTRGLGARRGSSPGRPRGEQGWSALTATERDVVALLREGLPNREIAARLYISRRTVETHVSHVLAKTGLRSRLEVATATEELE